MEELSLREIQSCEYKILKRATDWMDENGIAYMLTGGTLLGAIRHNGFIPWDDDIDLFVPRPDYDRMKKLIRQGKCDLGDGIEPRIPGDEGCYEPFAIFIDKNYIVDRSRFFQPKVRLYLKIDLFPLERIPVDPAIYMKERWKIERLRQLLWAGLRYPPDVRRFGRVKLLWLIRRAAYYCHGGYRGVVRRMERYSRWVHRMNPHSRRWGDLVWVSRTFPRHFIDTKKGTLDTQKHRFEEDMFDIPVEYDQYLRNIYGEYMVLPPEEERVKGHGDKVYRVGT